jgi:hypothetical protein
MNVPEIDYTINELLGIGEKKVKQPSRSILRDECKIERMNSFMFWYENVVKSIHKIHNDKFNEILTNRI